MITIPLEHGMIEISAWGVLILVVVPLALLALVALFIALFAGWRQH